METEEEKEKEKQEEEEERNKKSAWNRRRGISVAICSRSLIYKSVRVAVGQG